MHIAILQLPAFFIQYGREWGFHMTKVEVYRPKNHVRFVTASSLFDGHDASVNIMRRILQSSGVEVIH